MRSLIQLAFYRPKETMARTAVAALCVALLLAFAGADKCHMSSKSKYPPDPSTAIKWVDIDLDKPAQVWDGGEEGCFQEILLWC